MITWKGASIINIIAITNKKSKTEHILPFGTKFGTSKSSIAPSCKINFVYFKNYHDKRINYNHRAIAIWVLRRFKKITTDWLLKQKKIVI